MKHRIVFVAAVAVAVAGVVAAAPWRYVVDGVSMGPGLLPGDVVATGWLPALDRWRSPERFERWIVTLPDGSTGLKRVIGLPGEAVSLDTGDLVVDGRTVVKGPRLLAEIGSALETCDADGGSWSAAPAVVLDDAPFATREVSRILVPVPDVGFAAEVLVTAAGDVAEPVHVQARAGPLTVRWRLLAPGRYAVTAGRLDGRAVAAAWPVTDRSGPHGRRCLPPAAPERWDVTRPWPRATAGTGDDRSPALAVTVTGSGASRATIARVTGWRDVLLRPAADRVAAWSLAAADIFVLGDFPSGSRDSRHFGPLDRAALRHPLPR